MDFWQIHTVLVQTNNEIKGLRHDLRVLGIFDQAVKWLILFLACALIANVGILVWIFEKLRFHYF